MSLVSNFLGTGNRMVWLVISVSVPTVRGQERWLRAAFEPSFGGVLGAAMWEVSSGVRSGWAWV